LTGSAAENQITNTLLADFPGQLIKSIKFKDESTFDELQKQLKSLNKKFQHIVSSPKNLSITLHKFCYSRNGSQRSNSRRDSDSSAGKMSSNDQSE
jgi:hypothetical protein